MAETRWGWTRSHRARKCRMDDVAGDSAGDSAASPSGHAWLGQASRSRPGISVVTEVMLSRCWAAQVRLGRRSGSGHRSELVPRAVVKAR